MLLAQSWQAAAHDRPGPSFTLTCLISEIVFVVLSRGELKVSPFWAEDQTKFRPLLCAVELHLR